MKNKFLSLLIIVAIMIGACKKENQNVIIIEGYIKNKTSKLGLPDMNVYLEIYKTGKGMGIIDGSRNEVVGTVITDKNGFFTIQAKTFEGAEAVKFVIYPSGSDASREVRIQLSDLHQENMPISLEY